MQVVAADIDLEARAKVYFSDNGQRMSGSMNITKLTLTKRYARLNSTSQFSLDELADISKGLIGKMANAPLRKGVPIPKLKGVELRESQMLSGV